MRDRHCIKRDDADDDGGSVPDTAIPGLMMPGLAGKMDKAERQPGTSIRIPIPVESRVRLCHALNPSHRLGNVPPFIGENRSGHFLVAHWAMGRFGRKSFASTTPTDGATIKKSLLEPCFGLAN